MQTKFNHQSSDYHQQYQIGPSRPSNKRFGTNLANNSRKPNSPKYSFGRSTREQQPKRYVTKQMATTENFGKQTLMGYYAPKDSFSRSKSPTWKISTTARLKTQAQYQYYQHENNQINIDEADNKRRPKSAQTHFGNEQRFKDPQKSNQIPGPQYYPQAQPPNKQPVYSIGMRRAVKGFDPFKPLETSNQKVGPGTYRPEKSPLTATHRNSPKWSMPRSPKIAKVNLTAQNQTYEVGSSMGNQKLSSRPSQPKISINKTSRNSKGPIMKAHMQFLPVQVRISHPNF